MHIQLDIFTEDQNHLRDAIAMLSALLPDTRTNHAMDVPSVPIEQALDEIDALAVVAARQGRLLEAYAEAAIDPVFRQEMDALTPPPAAASEGDAFAAMQAAVQRGVQLPAIVELLTARKAQKVNQLSPDDRATFVVAIGKLGGQSE